MRSGSTRVSQFLSGIGKMATRVFSGNKRRLDVAEKEEYAYPPELRPKKKHSGGGGGSGMTKRGPRSMPGYFGYLRGTRASAVQARLNFIWQGCRDANRIAKQRREEYLCRKRSRALGAAQGMVTV